MSARTAALTPGYWTLTATSRPSSQARLVDLADRGGGDRHRVEGLEDLVERLVVLLLEDLLHVLEGDLRRRVAQLGELGLELLAELLGDQADVEERHHLAELHRRALHRPQRGDDLLGGLDLAAAPAPSGGLLVGRVRFAARVPACLAPGRRQAADLGGARAGARSGSASSRGPSDRQRPLATLLTRATMSSRAVGPAHPGLVAAVVVVAEQDERRRLAQRGARLVALGVQAAPDADERVVLPLLGDRRRVGVARADHGLGRQREQHVHDRGLEVGVGGAARARARRRPSS